MNNYELQRLMAQMQQAQAQANSGAVNGYELVGNYQLVGNGMNAMVQQQPVQQMQMVRAMAAPNVVPSLGFTEALQTADLTRFIHQKIAGLGSQTIGAGATVDFVLNAKEVIRIERMLVDAASLAGIQVIQMSVGTRNLNLGGGSIPASVFAPTAFDTRLSAETVNPGIPFTVTIRNTTTGNVDVSVACIGKGLYA